MHILPRGGKTLSDNLLKTYSQGGPDVFLTSSRPDPPGALRFHRRALHLPAEPAGFWTFHDWIFEKQASHRESEG
jgi:hypothetical protein